MNAHSPTGAAPQRVIDPLGLAGALFTLFAWSTAPLLVKYFTAHIDAWTSNGWRYAIGALMWTPAIAWLAARRRLDHSIWRRALVPAVFNTLGQAAFVAAFYQTGAAMVTFGLRVHIVFVALGAALLFPLERRLVRSPLFLAAAALVLVGTATVAAFHPAFRGGGDPAQTARGIGLSVLAGFGFAGYALAVRKCMRRYHPIASFAVIAQYTASAMIVLMLVLSPTRGGGALSLTPALFVVLVVSAIVPIGLAHVAYYTSINRLGVALTSGLVQLQPFCVAACSVPLLNERLSVPQWAGGGVAVAGALLMLRAQQLVARGAPAHRSVEASGDRAFDDLPLDAVVAVASGDEAPTPTRDGEPACADR